VNPTKPDEEQKSSDKHHTPASDKDKREQDDELNEALKETFPTSDPIAPSNPTTTIGPDD
jgi:hypothetical protein